MARLTKAQIEVLKAISGGDRVYWSHVAGKFYLLKRRETVPELVKAATIYGLRKRGLIVDKLGKTDLTELGEVEAEKLWAADAQVKPS